MSERLDTSYKSPYRTERPIHPRLRRVVALRLLRDEAEVMGFGEADGREWAERELEVREGSTEKEET